GHGRHPAGADSGADLKGSESRRRRRHLASRRTRSAQGPGRDRHAARRRIPAAVRRDRRHQARAGARGGEAVGRGRRLQGAGHGRRLSGRPGRLPFAGSGVARKRGDRRRARRSGRGDARARTSGIRSGLRGRLAAGRSGGDRGPGNDRRRPRESRRRRALGTRLGACPWRHAPPCCQLQIQRGVRMNRSLLAPLLAGAVLVPSSASADEGMWTFDNFPIAAVNAKYGTHIDQAWLDHVRGASARLSTGCSSSVVTATGLLLTNNHCVAGCTQDLSTKAHDYYTHGYIAHGRVEERKCAGMQAEILAAISDVTPQMQAAGRGLTGEALVKARTAAEATIEKQGCGDDPKFRCQVVDLYHGGQFKLYKYRKYSDVRLVFSPGVQTAFFGGDPDNFNFPRYDLDSAFVRLYENGAPVATPDHLKWNASAPTAGEPVFVSGNPGGTDRQLTVPQLETQRDLQIPMTLVQFSELRGRLIRFSEESAENKRIAQDLLFGLENSYKVYFGRLFALNGGDLLAQKQAEETALRAKVAQLNLGPDFGDPWATIANAQKDLAALYLPYRLVEAGPTGSDLFGYARSLVRAAAERQKPSAERLPGYSDTQLPLLQKQVLDVVPVYPSLEQQVLEFWLSKSREYLTA